MANLTNLNIGIGAELGSLKAGLSKAQKQITSFSEGVESRLGNISMGRLDKGLQGITQNVPAANKAVKKMGSNFQRGTSQVRAGSAAVVNFNRVIQDAPFGIIGVANNLEPLATSFQNLGDETSTTRDKIGLLLKKSFTGPGALITAVSLASSALLVLQQRFRGTDDEAEELTDTMENLNSSWETTIDLQNKFGAFDQDRTGLIEAQAKIREISEDIGEQQVKLNKINQLEARRDEIKQQIAGSSGLITASLDEELERINQHIKRLGEGEQVRLRIKKLQEDRQAIAEELVNIGDALADSDTQQARQKERTADATEAQLEAQREIASLQLGGFVDVPASEMERMADAVIRMPKVPFGQMNRDLQVTRGSIADLQMRLQAFQNMRAVVDPTSAAFDDLTQSIALTEQQIAELNGETENIKEQGVQNIDSLTMGFGRLAGAIIKGKKEALSFSNIMSAVLPGLLNVLFPGGGAVGGLLSGIVGGIFHDGGVVPGPMGQEQLALVQGGETIRTPAQERALQSGGGNVKVHITGELRAQGTDLVATINQTQSGTLR